MSSSKIIVRISNADDLVYVNEIVHEINKSSEDSPTSILKRSSDLIANKIKSGHAIIAVTELGEWIGFCYLQSWSNGEFVANCGLVVAPEYRRKGVARLIKQHVVELSKVIYPEAKLFGLTTSLAVMKINSDLGYKPVTYSQITSDDLFWLGCSQCPNYSILQKRERKNCLCTAMMYQKELETV
ncbi:MAG TPA: GNAT family N-acetyltransferase [Flavisolibacter sp.]|nr:GNAT family N-acetyltransferase [Flavisolibacter sp.]